VNKFLAEEWAARNSPVDWREMSTIKLSRASKLFVVQPNKSQRAMGMPIFFGRPALTRNQTNQGHFEL
jgi:hypothetical protein